MKRIFTILCSFTLMLSLTACSGTEQTQSSTDSSASSVSAESDEQENISRQIQITTTDGNSIVFALNDSAAASDLYHQLPLTVEVENYGSDEKIFYPTEKLNTDDAPLASGPAGTLAYYAPWGDVAIYYGDCGGASGLYELGEAVSGTEYIADLTGEIKIDVASEFAASSESAASESNSGVSHTPSSEPKSTPQQSQQPEAADTPSSKATAPSSQTPSSETTDGSSSKEISVTKMNVQIGGNTFTATLASNAAVDSFVEMMKSAPVVIQMSDYSGFEKVGSLGNSLPTSNSQTTTQTGDIVLYNGNQIVIFYGSNSWSYTRLGKIDDLSGWEDALGSGDVSVTFSVD